MPYGLRLKVHHAALAKLAIASAFQAEDHGFESRMPLQPFYISSVNGNGCFAARVRGLMRKAQTANLSSNSQAVKTFPFNGNYAGSIPASVKRCALVTYNSFELVKFSFFS